MHQVAQNQPVPHAHDEAGSEQARPNMERHQRLTGGEERAVSAPAAASWRNVTTVRRLRMPKAMKVHSTIRAVTYPRARTSFCRLRMGNSTTAVPMFAM